MNKNNIIFSLLLLTVMFCIVSFGVKKKQEVVLVFSKTNGYRHKSIEAGLAAIKKMGKENNFLVDATEDSLQFNPENLARYKAIIFLSPTGHVLGEEQQKAFEQYIKKGGGFVGVHAATDCEYNWAWYIKLVGGSFLSHPAQQTAKLIVTDKNNIATRHLPAIWERKDEWYNFKELNPDVHVLIKIDETSYSGGKNGDNHPMAWFHEYDGGRVFYTALGHTDESYSEPAFYQHLLGGINYALGRKN